MDISTEEQKYCCNERDMSLAKLCDNGEYYSAAMGKQVLTLR